MPRYGDLDKLEKELNERLRDLRVEYGDYDAYTDGFENAVERVEQAPTADVVEVVYCEDCKYCDIGENEVDAWCDCSLFNIGGVADFYCKAGERRNDEA